MVISVPAVKIVISEQPIFSVNWVANAIGVVLMSLSLNLNIFHTLF